MTEVFADTFYFIAVLGTNEQERAKALGVADPAPQLVTTTSILTEVANFMRQPHERAGYVEMVEILSTSADVTIVQSDHDLWRRGLDLFANRHGQGMVSNRLHFLRRYDRPRNYRRADWRPPFRAGGV